MLVEKGERGGMRPRFLVNLPSSLHACIAFTTTLAVCRFVVTENEFIIVEAQSVAGRQDVEYLYNKATYVRYGSKATHSTASTIPICSLLLMLSFALAA